MLESIHYGMVLFILVLSCIKLARMYSLKLYNLQYTFKFAYIYSRVVLFAIIYYCLKFHLIDGYWLLFTCISPLIMIVYLWKRISDKEINLLTCK